MDLFGNVDESEASLTEVVFAVAGAQNLVNAEVADAGRGQGLELTPMVHSFSLSELNHLLQGRPVSFVIGAAAPNRMSLVDCTAITAVYSPPLILVHGETMTSPLRDKMRQAGATALVHRGEGPHAIASAALLLARSWAWLRIPLGRVDVAGAIQRMAAFGDERCLVIGCPHVAPLLHEPWKALRPCRNDRRCKGWFGRVYLRDGIIAAAETPGAQGLAALSELMELRLGQVACQDVFIAPAESNVDLPVEAALLHAATMTDHRHAGIQVA